jgi:aspartyl/asparaginyl-tRNA synthetase
MVDGEWDLKGLLRQMLGLDNIKEAVLFPGTVKRITP